MKKGLILKLIIATLSLASVLCFAIGCGVVHNIDSGLVFTLSKDNKGYSVTDYTGLSTNVIIPTTYLGRPVTSIGSEAFDYCTELTNISIPNTVKSVGHDAFKGCTKLQYNIEGNLKYLGNISNKYLCLMGTTSTSITSASINANCKVIGSRAFNGCRSLTSVVIGDSVTSIGYSAFYGCSKLTSVVIPDSVTSIGSSAFRNCYSLTSVTIGKNVTSIGNYAFYFCESLRSVEIPNSVTSIGDYAFYGCTSLTSVTIGKNVSSIGNYAFYYCESLTVIIFKGTVLEWNAIEKGNYWKSYVPATRVGCSNGVVAIS